MQAKQQLYAKRIPLHPMGARGLGQGQVPRPVCISFRPARVYFTIVVGLFIG